MSSRPVHRAQISAHRGGAGESGGADNERSMLEDAARSGAEWVEFDVQLLGDGQLVVAHDDSVVAAGVTYRLAELGRDDLRRLGIDPVLVGDALAVLAAHGARAHVDIKFATDDGAVEREIARAAVAALGAHSVLVTTSQDVSVTAVREWSAIQAPDLLVGLSLGRGFHGLRPARLVGVLVSELFPARRLRRCQANLMVANRRLARIRLARFAARAGLPLLVWTVDDDRQLVRWLRDPRVLVVTTNRPRRALELRAAVR